MLDLSIVVINYNTKKMVQNLIRFINIYTNNINYEIIIVDNSKEDHQRIENNISANVKVLYTDNNGFWAACNQGVRIANGQYLLFINSDTVFKNNVISQCIDYMDSNLTIGILGCKLVLPDGSLDHGCKRGFPTPQAALYYYLKLDKKYPQSKKYGAYRMTYLSDNEISEVDAVSGAFLMIRKKLFERLNGFDETFFMYGEDLDLCLRVKQNGFKVVYFPNVTVTHLKGQSGLNVMDKFALYNFYKAMIIFYNKHYKNRYNFFVTWLVHIAIWSKYYLDLIKLKVKR